MEHLPTDILKHILIAHFSYREQCVLADVCWGWLTIIQASSSAVDDQLDKMAAELTRINKSNHYDLRELLEVYQLLCEPEYRLLFIHPRMRNIRCKITYMTHEFHHLMTILDTVPNSTTYHQMYVRIHDILTELYQKIDTELTPSGASYHIHRYWARIRRANMEMLDTAITADMTYDQYRAIFGE